MDTTKTKKTTQRLKQKDIEAIIPHRFENILIDTCKKEQDTLSFSVTIQEHDALKRDLFLVESEKTKLLAIPLLAEVLALASIICENPSSADIIPIFASITHFYVESPFQNSTLSGYVKHKNSKQGFFRYEGIISDSLGNTLKANLMAYATKKTELSTHKDPEKTYPLPELQASRMFSKVPYKNPNLSCITSIERLEKHEIITSFSYPLSHPLIKGHFPKNPVMMGVMQWVMVEDATYAHAIHHKSQYPNANLKANATIINHNNDIVCELVGLILCVQPDSKHNFFVYTKGAKRIFFRSVVKPGSHLFCHLVFEAPSS